MNLTERVASYRQQKVFADKHPIITAYNRGRDDSCFDFYRCSKCFRMITRGQEIKRIGSGRICRCGSAKYLASNPVGFDWLRPSILAEVGRFILTRWVAVKYPSTADRIEKLLT